MTLLRWNIDKRLCSDVIQHSAITLSPTTMLLSTHSSKAFLTTQLRLEPAHIDSSSFFGIVLSAGASNPLPMISLHDQDPSSNLKPPQVPNMRDSRAASTGVINLSFVFTALEGMMGLWNFNPRSFSSLQKFSIHLFLKSAGIASSQVEVF